jgi:hypothetical protein
VWISSRVEVRNWTGLKSWPKHGGYVRSCVPVETVKERNGPRPFSVGSIGVIRVERWILPLRGSLYLWPIELSYRVQDVYICSSINCISMWGVHAVVFTLSTVVDGSYDRSATMRPTWIIATLGLRIGAWWNVTISSTKTEFIQARIPFVTRMTTTLDLLYYPLFFLLCSGWPTNWEDLNAFIPL